MRAVYPFEMRATPSKAALRREWRVSSLTDSRSWDRNIRFDLMWASSSMEVYLNHHHALPPLPEVHPASPDDPDLV